MVRIAGIDLPHERRLEITPTYIYGVGRIRATETPAAMGINPNPRAKDATEEDLAKPRKYIDNNFKVEDDLCHEVQADVRRKIEIGSYQGFCCRRDLSAHGRHAKTSARACRGPKRIVADEKKVK